MYFELLDFTYELALTFNALPFEIFKQDKDEVIMLINYFIEKADTNEATGLSTKTTKTENNAQKRVRVNDKTATGGWF